MSMTPAQIALAEAIAAKTIGDSRATTILPFYLGGFIDSMLLGVVVVQVFQYLPFVKTDKKRIIAFVVGMVLCTLAATIDVMMWLTHIFVWHYGQFISFATGIYNYRYLIIDLLSCLIAQAFYVDRAYRLHGHWWPLLVLGFPVLAALALGSTFISLQAKNLEMLVPTTFTTGTLGAMAFAWNGSILFADLLITIVMLYGLNKNKTGWRHTDSKLKGLMVRCVEAQVPALMIATITLVMWTTKLEIAILCLMAHTKIYAAGVLATLNFRVRSDKPEMSDHPYRSTDLSSGAMSGFKNSQLGSMRLGGHSGTGNSSTRCVIIDAEGGLSKTSLPQAFENPEQGDQADSGKPWGSGATLNRPVDYNQREK